MIRRYLFAAAATWLLFVAGCTGAFAHPHVWIDARATLVFDKAGLLTAIKHRWTFDEAFSAWSVQGLDTNGDGRLTPDELQDLADQNMVGLKQYHYYTYAGESDDKDVAFTPTGDQEITWDGKQTTLTFTLKPSAPVSPGPDFEIEVTDPEYYAAFTFVDDGLQMVDPPSDCTTELNPPKEIPDALAARFYNLPANVTELPPDLKKAAEDLANVIILRCDRPLPAAGNALDATRQMAHGAVAAPAAAEPAASAGSGKAPGAAAEIKAPTADSVAEATIEGDFKAAMAPAAPFLAPPVERGMPTIRTGILGWAYRIQQTFYGSLTKALGALKTDANAFWFLGTVSFLYGVFHAVGPGHGKVVISSYVLATEAELKRGLALSFAGAVMQSVTAIAFILIAAVILDMTSAGLAQASGFLVTGSYLLVVLVGVWLVIRKVFGLGHHHHHAHAPHDHGHDHHHHHHGEHEDHHHHMVTPRETHGTWREMLGVVLAVGLRPCSGALVVLVFALSQGVLPAGIASVFLMGFGTAITVSTLAVLAVALKGSTRLFGNGIYGEVAMDVLWWLELAGALLVLAFGTILFLANV